MKRSWDTNSNTAILELLERVNINNNPSENRLYILFSLRIFFFLEMSPNNTELNIKYVNLTDSLGLLKIE